MREIYIDNSATTKVLPRAAAAAMSAMTEQYGNPSSLHRKGIEAELLMEEARRSVAEAMGAQAGELTFTSGGTEANNLALLGGAEAKKRRGRRVITSAYEHDSVLAACKRLEESGFEVVYLRPESDGRISPEALAEAVDEQTVLVSIMLVNNEIGAVNPIAKLSAAAKSVNPELVFHTDAVQGFCKIPFSTSGLGVDFVTVTAHKIGGPKGIGALWIKKGARVIARNLGGEQERRLRGGTEALPLIAAFGEAARESAQEQPEYAKRMSMLHEHLCAALSGEPGILINSPEGALDSIVNLSVLGARSEIMLHFLEERGIYVSSGSACARGKKSHVLTALGLARERTDSALRISFGRENTTEDVDTLAAALLEARERFSKK